MIIEIVKLKLAGWYSFENIPQEDRYIKIGALNCQTDRKALNTAKKINSKFTYVIKVDEKQ